MGSVAYGVAGESSDVDTYGFCIPAKNIIFPHLAGWIPGFGAPPKTFEDWQQAHIKDPGAEKEYDLMIFSIVKYFNLAMKGTPNIIDSLFTPERCVIISSPAARIVRDNRRLFLSKRVWNTFKGYAYAQVRNIRTNEPTGKRKELIEKHGWDIKHGYHTVRLLNEVEQILTRGDLVLDENREQLKAIRAGQWSIDQFLKYFETKELELESIKNKSTLPEEPDEEAIKKVLVACLNTEYKTCDDALVLPNAAEHTLLEIGKLLDSYQRNLAKAQPNADAN